MKKTTVTLLLLLLITITVQCKGPTTDEHSTADATIKKTKPFDLTKEVKIASIEDGKTVYTIDRNELLSKLNKEFSGDTLTFVSADVKKGKTIGDEKVSFYYMQFKSNRGLQLVRYLVKENNDFFFKQSKDDKDTYLDFYVSCNGVEGCVPNLYSSEEGLDWICGDKPGCVRPTKENYCSRNISVIY